MTPLTGTGLLIRLILRRDRLMLPLWIGALMATVAATITAFDGLYQDQAGRDAFAVSIRTNVVFRALIGPLFSQTSNGALTAWRTGTIGAVLLALMSTFLVTRHTRLEEETGRLELVGATAVGRMAPLTAVLMVAAAADLLAGLLCTGVLLAAGEDPAGAAAFGAALAGGGLVYAGLAALVAQLTETARAANNLVIMALGAAFVLRAVGDSSTGSAWVTWASPLGWVENVRAFADERVWVVALLTGTAVALGVVAVTLNARRDLGGSLLRSRPGPAGAAPSLAGPFGLWIRLQRGAVVGWGVVFVLLGVVFGALSASIGDLAGSSPQFLEILRQLGGAGALLDAFFSGVLGLAALFASGYGVSTVLRLRADETALLVEPVLAAGVSRLRVLGAPAAAGFVVPAVLMLLAGSAAGTVADATLDDGVNHLGQVLTSAVVQIPAVWVIVGVALALVGVAPHWTGAAWGGLAFSALVAQIGPILDLPALVLNLSPFSAVPRVGGGVAVPAAPLVTLTLLAAGLIVVGVVGFRRRDIG